MYDSIFELSNLFSNLLYWISNLFYFEFEHLFSNHLFLSGICLLCFFEFADLF